MAVDFTEDHFDKLAIQTEKIVMVDFWAAWCGPCKMVGPIVEELANDFEGKAVIGKVDVDKYGSISAKYGVRNIPTIIFLKNGEVVDKSVGAVPKATLVAKLEALMA